jgi:hypothetical protein
VSYFRVRNGGRNGKKKGEKRPEDAGGAPMLTRAEAAQMLGVSKTTLRLYEKRELVQPIFVDGIHWFARATIRDAMKARQHGHSAAAFALFEQGKTPVEVVLELDVEPERIQHLWECYHRLQGCWIVKGPGSLRAWERTYRLGELTPAKLLRALELVCSNPTLREQLLASG